MTQHILRSKTGWRHPCHFPEFERSSRIKFLPCSVSSVWWCREARNWDGREGSRATPRKKCPKNCPLDLFWNEHKKNEINEVNESNVTIVINKMNEINDMNESNVTIVMNEINEINDMNESNVTILMNKCNKCNEWQM